MGDFMIVVLCLWLMVSYSAFIDMTFDLDVEVFDVSAIVDVGVDEEEGGIVIMKGGKILKCGDSEVVGMVCLKCKSCKMCL